MNSGVYYKVDLAKVRKHGRLAPGKGSKLTDVKKSDIEAPRRVVLLNVGLLFFKYEI